MTRDDIIAMAREAGFVDESFCRWGAYTDDLERFAALVAAAERNRLWTQEHWTEYERAIVAAEREACARVCDEQAESPALAPLEKYRANFIADAIRARGAK